MRHRKDHRKLSRTHSHRRALLRNLVTSLFIHERIETTVAKAMEARRVGERMITVSVWEDEDAPRALLRGGTHKEAMQRFLGAGFTMGGLTSVMTPGRINAKWARCTECDKMADSEKLGGNCSCGAALPSLLYW